MATFDDLVHWVTPQIQQKTQITNGIVLAYLLVIVTTPGLLCVGGEPGNEAIMVIDSTICGSKQTEAEVRASINGTHKC